MDDATNTISSEEVASAFKPAFCDTAPGTGGNEAGGKADKEKENDNNEKDNNDKDKQAGKDSNHKEKAKPKKDKK